jgi:hypothetical protein
MGGDIRGVNFTPEGGEIFDEQGDATSNYPAVKSAENEIFVIRFWCVRDPLKRQGFSRV